MLGYYEGEGFEVGVRFAAGLSWTRSDRVTERQSRVVTGVVTHIADRTVSQGL